MSNYREVQLFDETTQDTGRVYRSDWYGLDEKRLVEYFAAQLLAHDYSSGIVWMIVEQRARRNYQWTLAEIEYHRRIFSKWRYFATVYREKSPAAHVQAAAETLGVTNEEVVASILWIEAHGIPEAA